MPGSVTRAALPLLAALALAGCAGPDRSDPSGNAPSPGRMITIDGDAALRWGDGDYGVVLAHGGSFDAASWERQASAIADQQMTVVAVEDIEPEAIGNAVERLQDDGIGDVALVGASAGADAILDLATQQPALADQLILLSPNATVEGLGTQPKLFIASEDDPVADPSTSTELAESAPGGQNTALIVPGSTHSQGVFESDQARPVLDAILERLQRFADS